MKHSLLRFVHRALPCLALIALVSCSMQDEEFDSLEPETSLPPEARITLGSSFICTPAPEGPNDNTLRMGVEYTLRPNIANLTNHALKYNVYQVDGPEGEYEMAQNLECATITFYKPGMYRVVCTSAEPLMNDANLPCTNTYVVPAQEPWIEGPETIYLHQNCNFSVMCWNPYISIPSYNVHVSETYYNDPQYKLLSNKNGIVCIHFEQAGNYEIKVGINNIPNMGTGIGIVKVYPKYYYKIDTQKDGEKDGLTQYRSRLYFYEDEACTTPMKVPGRTAISYEISYYGFNPGGQIFPLEPYKPLSTNALDPVIRIPEGVYYVDLPVTYEKLGKQGFKTIRYKPYFTINYLDSGFIECNPYRQTYLKKEPFPFDR